MHETPKNKTKNLTENKFKTNIVVKQTNKTKEPSKETKEIEKVEPLKNSTKTKSIAKNDDDLIDSLVNEAMSNLDTKVDVSKLIKNNESNSKKNTKPIKTAATYLPAKKK